MEIQDLPALNAALNATAGVFISIGYLFVRRGHRTAHKRCMLAALTASTLFLVSYVVYHASAGSRPYQGEGASRVVYFAILITHVILAAAIVPLALVTANRGLLPADTPVRPDDLRALGLVDIRSTDPRYRAPLLADLDRLRSMPDLDPVLLGSVATGKYVDVLLEALGVRLRFPPAFVGRGDMSRGGLMLRCVREDRELSYISIAGATRHGKRPAKLARDSARRAGN